MRDFTAFNGSKKTTRNGLIYRFIFEPSLKKLTIDFCDFWAYPNLTVEQYWIYKEGYLQGPYQMSELVAQDDFTAQTPICRYGEETWRPAMQFESFQRYVSAAKVIRSGDYIAPTTVPIESVRAESAEAGASITRQSRP